MASRCPAGICFYNFSILFPLIVNGGIDSLEGSGVTGPFLLEKASA